MPKNNLIVLCRFMVINNPQEGLLWQNGAIGIELGLAVINVFIADSQKIIGRRSR